ncbi:rubredoxin [Anaeromicrobium sediminis]|uniref:Rubredoxin n=1 Tax=Anaeromicrobium sediminis TaxID=1478221 RepID=A0A267MBE5_9FIRM|nr:rubredoxin [Anaeromicrobium sediminis]PAB56901.1 rubredoxin [Anaeromicrobium sediminis]
MEIYKCSVCGYSYKEEKGDWTNDIKAGTKWEDLPEYWRCPTCNQPKMAFAKMKR